MEIKLLTIKQRELINKNWLNGIAPKQCNGNCNLIEGGGELDCHSCGWSDTEIDINQPLKNA